MNIFSISKKITFNSIITGYILIFAFISVIYLMQIPSSYIQGEWDDYTIMTASFLNDGNFTISPDDILFFKNLFPDWAQAWDNGAALSGFYAKNGDQLAFYAPFYSLYCVPFVLFTSILSISNTYAFRLANLFIWIIALYQVNKTAKLKDSSRFLLILALSLHPIFLIMKWPSGEVFGYAVLMLSVIYWMEKKYHKAAFFCAIAGTFNIVIFVWGLVMIPWYLYCMRTNSTSSEPLISFFLRRWKTVFKYGCCYIIGILPILFNLYEVGNINITANAGFTAQSIRTVIENFIAYFIDLNFGFLPYFTILLFFNIFIFILALKTKAFKYIALMVAFLGIAFGYSMIFHINCGMEGISRYNSWNSVFLIIMGIYGLEELIHPPKLKTAFSALIALGIALTFFITRLVSPNTYVEMLPVASFVLNHYPHLYNPLPSTFNSRISHIDGGYNYKCPIIYYDDNGFARKNLVDSDSKNTVLKQLSGNSNDNSWLLDQLNTVTEEQYISINKKRHLRNAIEMSSGEICWFSGENWNASKYIDSGISNIEGNYTWTTGNELLFKPMYFENTKENQPLLLKLNILSVYNNNQRIVVYCNGKEIFNDTLIAKTQLEIPFQTDENGYFTLSFSLPDAISPNDLGISNDTRKLALALDYFRITEN